MQGVIIDALSIVGACLLIAAAAVAMFVVLPSARRRRRHKRRSRRPRIDLFAPPRSDPPTEPDA
jgi:Flp pilus assembly protein TadB